MRAELAIIRDHIVEFLSDDRVIETALQWRAAFVPGSQASFDVTKFIEEVFLRRQLSRRPVKLELRDHSDIEDIAFVTYTPDPIMHMDRELWRETKLGEPRGRFILGHEIGHVVFHSHSAKAFTLSSDDHVKSVQPQNSAEHHANLFSDHFLVPDSLVKLLKQASRISVECDVEKSLAERRVFDFSQKYLRSVHRTSEICPSCSAYLFQRGTRIFCKGCFYAVSV